MDATPASAVNYPQQAYEYEEEEDDRPTQPPQTRRQQYLRPNNFQNKQNAIDTRKRFEEELEEVEEPDRLALLLEKSSFQCDSRTG